jgi:hypothetical protein
MHTVIPSYLLRFIHTIVHASGRGWVIRFLPSEVQDFTNEADQLSPSGSLLSLEDMTAMHRGAPTARMPYNFVGLDRGRHVGLQSGVDRAVKMLYYEFVDCGHLAILGTCCSTTTLVFHHGRPVGTAI